MISIIIPMYQAEMYIQKCVHSILQNTLDFIEVILLDDGSSDKSLAIGEKLERQYFWLRVIHQQNHGVSYTRNRGIEYAKGRFIWFVDADDEIISNSIGCAVQVLRQYDPDVLVFGYKSHLERKYLNEFDVICEGDSKCYSKVEIKEIFWKLFSTNIIHNIGTKIYKKSIINKNCIRFCEEFSIFEDAMFCMDALTAAETFYVSKDVFYTYNLQVNNGSLNHIYRKNYDKAMKLLYQKIFNFILIKDEYFYNNFLCYFIGALNNEFRRADNSYENFSHFINCVLRDREINEALQNAFFQNTSKYERRILENVLKGRFKRCYFKLKIKYIEGNIFQSKFYNLIFDSCYFVYKSLLLRWRNK
ncbi:putative glycosyltransferase EpsJ [Lachnospiraceae bacterium]|nr:putative glycosyltransferase EpsJ [Lachnospiraceae bacterium]